MAGKATCPECCGDCIIATDDFNRDDSDDLGGLWLEESGDTDIDNNELLFVTGPAIVVFQTNHPGGVNAPRRVKVRFKMPTGSGVLQIFPAFTDQDDRIEAQISIGTCDEITLLKYEAGVQTYLNPDGTSASAQIIGDGITEEEWNTLEVCLQPGTGYYAEDGILRVKVRLASGKVYGHQYTGVLSGALKVGMQGSPGIRIDDFSFEWMGGEDGSEHERCPECNTPCLVESDNFDRATSTDLGCKWTEVSGLWQIASDELKMFSGGPGIALCRVFHPQIKTHHHVTANLYVDAGLKPRVIVNSTVDASSYHWAQLELSGTTLTLTIGKDGATLATETSSLSAAGFVGITVCYDGSVLTATANGETVFDTSTAVADGIYVGLSGNSTGGERFDNFIFQKHRSFTDPQDPNCPFCEELFTCHAVCIDDLMNAHYLAEFDPPAAGTCVDPSVCANIPTTHAVRFVEEGIGCKTHNGVEYCGRECHFIGSLFDSCGGISDAFLAVEFWLTDGGDRLIIASMGGTGSAKAVWILELPGEIDCLTLSNLELPLVASWDSSDPCDWSVVGPLRLSVT